MSNNFPRISIITAVYNRKNTVSDALSSILSQTYKDVELIVIDGASTDGTLDIIRSFGDSVSQFVSETDHGIYDALNKGVQLAAGDVIGFMHSDDLFYDATALEKIASCFSETGVDAVYGDLVYVDENNIEKVVRRWKSDEFNPKKLTHGWMPPHPTFYMTKKCYEQIGLFSLDFPVAADYEHLLRCFTSGISVRYIPETLVKMRAGGASNNSIYNIYRKYWENYRILKKYGFNAHRATIMKMASKLPQFRF